MGRFACDWHRLPRGSLPGNHRPRLGHRRIITTGRNRASERARCRKHAHLPGSGSAKGERTGRDRGPARQDVVDEQDPWSDEAGGHERAEKRLPARRARPPRLGRRFDDAVQQPPGRPSNRPCHSPSQGLGLVVATRSTPASGERHPGDGARFGIRLGRRRPGQGPHHPRSEPAAVVRRPANLSRMSAVRTGPSYRKAARDHVTGGGGQSEQRSTECSSGRPHERHPGGISRAMSLQHAWQNGHAPRPQPTQAGGKKVSRIRPSMSAAYGPALTRPVASSSGDVQRSCTGTGCDREPEPSWTTTSRRRACRGTG